MRQAMMTQKQKTLAEAAHAHPEPRFTNLYSLMHWDEWICTATSQQTASSWRAGCKDNLPVRFGERGRRNHGEESSYRRFRLYSTRLGRLVVTL
jgi:hypothetical protein